MLLIKVKRGFLACLTVFSTLAAAPGLAGPGQPAPAATAAPGKPAPDPQQDLRAAQEKVRVNPGDARAHLAVGDAWRHLGRAHEAAEEYLRASELDPQLYVAFHQLSTVNADPTQLDEAISRLARLKEEKPKELMLRVALSELYEKRGQYYQGARVLVDLVYMNAVPDRYAPRVNARIHYLLARSRDTQDADRGVAGDDDQLDAAPPPLPEATLHQDLAASRLKESRVSRGIGHAPLLP